MTRKDRRQFIDRYKNYDGNRGDFNRAVGQAFDLLGLNNADMGRLLGRSPSVVRKYPDGSAPTSISARKLMVGRLVRKIELRKPQ